MQTDSPNQKATREAKEAVRIAFTRAEDALARATNPHINPAIAKEAMDEADAASEAADAAYEAWVAAQAIADAESRSCCHAA